MSTGRRFVEPGLGHRRWKFNLEEVRDVPVEICEVESREEKASLVGAYAAPQAGDADSPCVILVHGVLGPDAFLSACLERLAGEGFHVLAPDLFASLGIEREAQQDLAAKAWAEVPDREALRVLERAAGWLGERGDRRSLAVLGFGVGGSLAFMMGCTSLRLAALVSIYGSTLYPELSSAKPTQPLELLLNLDRPFLGLFAEEDSSLPEGHHGLLEERLVAAHKDHELVRFPGTKHGFMDPHGPNYDEASASAAWQRTLTFLKDSL